MTPTKAGAALLLRFLECERRTKSGEIGPKLVEAKLRDGTPTMAMQLAFGQGAERSAALKLARDGLALASWNWARGTRLLVITEAGRESVSQTR